MKLSMRHILTAVLFATSAVAAACGIANDGEPSDPVQEVTPVEESPAAAAIGALAEGQRPISDAELAEVRRATDLAATLEILSEDGETIKLENGITSLHEGSLNGVDITFTPLDANGLPSRKTLEVVYQRSDTTTPYFYFVTDASESSSGAPALEGKPDGQGGNDPISTQCLGGSWSSWTTYGSTCGYRWLCSKKKWNHQATFSYQWRKKRCWNGNTQVEYRTHYEHCGC